jgi:hypothetical protein
MAAGSTYTPIATYTLSSTQTSVTFSSIPSTYTDLILIISAQSNSGYDSIRFNGDSGNNYSKTSLAGDGTSASSFRASNESRITLFGAAELPTSGSSYNVSITQMMNYSNSTTYKTILHRDANAATGTDAAVGLWRSTSAISSFVLYPHYNLPTSNVFNVGSTFTLYGIQAA